VSTMVPGSPPAGELMADKAYAELRDRIISLRIPPGAPINEDALGSELEMGRTPVREGIKRLALENLVTVYPRRGTFASEINITDLAHIADVRVPLEGHAAYRAAQRITARRREQLAELRDELEQHDDGDDPATLIALDAQIHRFVYSCADNPYLEQSLARYFNLSLRIWYLALDRLPHLGARVLEHRRLLDAIDAGDAENARDIAEEHVTVFEREIRSVL
jgi:DNA-binding GntR family transcriptional regulator